MNYLFLLVQDCMNNLVNMLGVIMSSAHTLEFSGRMPKILILFKGFHQEKNFKELEQQFKTTGLFLRQQSHKTLLLSGSIILNKKRPFGNTMQAAGVILW